MRARAQECRRFITFGGMAQDACCWTEFAGQHFSGAGQLAAALKKGTKFSSAPQLYPFDHIYPSASAANFKAWQAGNASAAVLYGTPGTTCFREIHQMLKDAVKSQHIAGVHKLNHHLHAERLLAYICCLYLIPETSAACVVCLKADAVWHHQC